MNTDIVNQLRAAKKATTNLNLIQSDTRTKILKAFATSLEKQLEYIIQENQKDLSLMLEQDPRYDRLLLNKDRILSLAHDVREVADLPNPLGVTLLEKSMPNGLSIKKITVPLGVIAVIYESRPNVTIDIFSLCFKTGNVSILKGGKEAHFTNSYLVSLIKNTLERFNINTDIVCLLPPIDHIQQFSSHHSEAIIAEDESAIEQFLNEVDSAVVYANTSTAFTDGGEFGLGAEIGISTQKVHVRGPMGLEALTSYKWVIRGAGQIRN